MARVLIFLFLASALAGAQPPERAPEPKKDAPPEGVERPHSPAALVTRLAASPAPAAAPALKYELLPRLRDRKPGNAAMDYHRAKLLQPNWPHDAQEAKKLQDTLIKWEEAPVDALPLAEVKKYLATHAASFRALDDAARADRCDWELGSKLSVGNIDGLLTEVQTFRELARFQKLRTRAALAEGKFDEAVRCIQIGMRLGKDVGEGPTLIHTLVGIAVASIFLGEVDHLIQRPGGPNMYWALTTLPRPVIDPRIAFEGEARLFDNLFPNARLLEKGVLSTDRANALLEEMMTAFQTMGRPDDKQIGTGGIGTTAYATMNYPGARKQLLTLGWDAAAIKEMPAAQVVALRAVAAYRSYNDDLAKCFSLNVPDARTEITKVRERSEKLRKESGDPIVSVFAMNVPAIEKTFEAHTRLNRRVALMRAVEAVRLHAAAGDGKPPKSLADIKLVPVPEDPDTLKPFVYELKGNTFTLTGAAPAGAHPSVINQLRYEITLRAQ
ncbi:hypothetical protein R5W23_001182 [Gemmata sp. JC673]|uniref:Uncharacterized protein n=1 Tax=Gemmata algarum TaxID=2975278 RepID=A0ABU5EXF4_9BACT|nr:hypothetical protein [Gemmata algarum]MDY3559983.1 hypothetical protein [Gemmata algarum]